MRDLFAKWAQLTSEAIGHPVAFTVAVAIVVVWALSGFAVGFTDTWQLVINTGTTVVTFLIVFLIQNTQNRTSEAAQLKLDELIRAVRGAHNIMIDVEDLPEDEIRRLQREFTDVAKRARSRHKGKATAQHTPRG